MSPAYRDAVHHREGKWWFWNETWSEAHGPFDTEAEARAACVEYARNL